MVLLVIVHIAVVGTLGAAFAEDGSVDITTEPEGAAIIIDGAEAGNTPAAGLNLESGSHTLLLKYPGYMDAVGEISVGPGVASKLDVRMGEKKSGSIVLPIALAVGIGAAAGFGFFLLLYILNADY